MSLHIEGHMGLKSSPLATTSCKLTKQFIVLQQINAHHKNMSKIKSSIDTTCPKSWYKHTNVRDQIRREKSALNSNRSRPTSAKSQNLSLYSLESPITEEKTFGVYQSPNSERSVKAKPNDVVPEIEMVDILDKNCNKFTDQKSFTPRILKNEKAAKLTQMRCYNPPKKKSKEKATVADTMVVDESIVVSEKVQSQEHCPPEQSMSDEEIRLKELDFLKELTDDILVKHNFTDREVEQTCDYHTKKNKFGLKQDQMRQLCLFVMENTKGMHKYSGSIPQYSGSMPQYSGSMPQYSREMSEYSEEASQYSGGRVHNNVVERAHYSPGLSDYSVDRPEQYSRDMREYPMNNSEDIKKYSGKHSPGSDNSPLHSVEISQHYEDNNTKKYDDPIDDYEDSYRNPPIENHILKSVEPLVASTAPSQLLVNNDDLESVQPSYADDNNVTTLNKSNNSVDFKNDLEKMRQSLAESHIEENEKNRDLLSQNSSLQIGAGDTIKNVHFASHNEIYSAQETERSLTDVSPFQADNSDDSTSVNLSIEMNQTYKNPLEDDYLKKMHDYDEDFDD